MTTEIKIAPMMIPRVAPVEPTPEEIRNGWTKEKLTEYLNQRRTQAVQFAFRAKKAKVARVENHFGFSPFDW